MVLPFKSKGHCVVPLSKIVELVQLRKTCNRPNMTKSVNRDVKHSTTIFSYHIQPGNGTYRGHLIYGPRRQKTCLQRFANNTGADQPAHPRSLISTFVIRLLGSIISRLAKSEFSVF